MDSAEPVVVGLGMPFRRCVTRPRRTFVASAGALALVLSGCSGSHEDPTVSPDPTTPQPIVDVLERGDDAPLTVISEGEEAVILRLAQGAAALDPEEREAIGGTLVVGPGGCLALQTEGQPELLIFKATIGFADDPPRVRIEDTETQVGQELSVNASLVDVADVGGLPQECLEDGAEQAWVVHID